MGDSNYAESVSPALTVTNAPFSISGAGTTAAIGSAANAALKLQVASGYTGAITLTCALPAGIAESACFVNPASAVGGGAATLTVNTTPAHASLRPPGSGTPRLGPISAGILSALLLPFLRRKRPLSGRLPLMAMLLCTALVALSGCSGQGTSARADPGTASGTYNVTVTATGISGAATYNTTITVPITVQ